MRSTAQLNQEMTPGEIDGTANLDVISAQAWILASQSRACFLNSRLRGNDEEKRSHLLDGAGYFGSVKPAGSSGGFSTGMNSGIVAITTGCAAPFTSRICIT